MASGNQSNKGGNGSRTSSPTHSDSEGETSGIMPSVSADRGSGVRTSGRTRSLSAIAVEALANGINEAEFMASFRRAQGKVKGSDRDTKAPMAAPATAPSTTTASGQPGVSSLSSHTHSHSQSYASAAPTVAVASSSSDHPLHGITQQIAQLAIDRQKKPSKHRQHRHTRHHRSPSRSSSPSSASSEDEYTRGKRSVYYIGRRIRAKDQMHLVMIRRVRELNRSFKDWSDTNKCSNTRNQYETDVLCAVMDQLLVIDNVINRHGDVALAQTSLVIAQELLCRRIFGVQQADTTGDWAAAQAVDLLQRRELTNDYITRTVNRDITATRAATAHATHSNHNNNRRGTSGRDRARGGGHARGTSGYRGRGSSSSSSSLSSSNVAAPPGGAKSS